jgi:GntR family transcriptional regulator/MocR family aminotransferase
MPTDRTTSHRRAAPKAAGGAGAAPQAGGRAGAIPEEGGRAGATPEEGGRAREMLVALSRAAGAPPLHAQLERELREAVRSGRLAAGSRLPSSRALAAELGVSRGVVVEAYAQLGAEGYLRARQGAAPRVAAVTGENARAAPPAAAVSPRYDLRPGIPDLSAFPRAAWAAAMRRVLRELPDADLGYPDPAGHPRLRAALAGYLGRVRGVAASPERVVVCAGVGEALTLAARCLSARGARTIGVEDPSHHGTREVLARAGLEPVPIPVDAGGLDPAALAAAGPDVVLVAPAHQFPTGVVLEPERRAAIVRWARATGATIVEDDYDAEYRYDRSPVGALQGLAPERVIHTSSVSKTLAPGLRLGWAVVPADLAASFADEKRIASYGMAVLEQAAMAELIERGELDRHLRRTRPIYRRRRDALLTALATARPGLAVEGVAAGLHVALRLPDGADEQAVVAAAGERGVAVHRLGEHIIATPRPPALLLGYARESEPALRAAARELAQAIG